MQQICRRICELDSVYFIYGSDLSDKILLKMEHKNGPLLLSNEFHKQFKQIHLNNYILSINSRSKADSYYFTKDNVIQIENTVSNNDQQIAIIGRYFESSSLYNYPFDSGFLRINVNNLSEIKMWSLDIRGKCLVMPYKENWVSVPLFQTLASF